MRRGSSWFDGHAPDAVARNPSSGHSGETGKLLHVDLTTRQTRVEELPETVLRKHLGGGALAAHLLLRDLPPSVDPLGPEDKLVFATSCREGFGPGDDVLPGRMHEGIGNGALEGERVDPEQLLAARRLYYQMAGWDPDTGTPTAGKLAELDVEAPAAAVAG